jgi:hypothetical protein
MRVSPHKVLAVALVVALPVAFCRRPPEPDPATQPVIGEAVGESGPEVVGLRALAKGLLARAAAAGRRSLFEAAALFRELDRLPPASAAPAGLDPALRIPVDTEAGRLCRQVVAAVRAELGDEPDRAEAAVARLEAEFFAELRARGSIRLPDPPPGEPVEELLRQARARAVEHQRGRSPRGADR